MADLVDTDTLGETMKIEVERGINNGWVAPEMVATVEVDEDEEAFLLAALDPGDYACVERSMMHSINAMDADPETTVKIKYRVWRHLERIID